MELPEAVVPAVHVSRNDRVAGRIGCAGSKVSFDVAAIDHDRILKAAGEALTVEPITITKYRAKLSEGGPNDFYSNGDYWWPNPDTTNGLPYVKRDGQIESRQFQPSSRVHLAIAQRRRGPRRRL